MTDVPTPRTDELNDTIVSDTQGYNEMLDLACALEREIAQQAARIDELTKALLIISGLASVPSGSAGIYALEGILAKVDEYSSAALKGDDND